MATLPGILRDPVKRPFRKAAIKRRNTSDGLFESSWFDITDFVERWGTFQTAVDDVRLNQFVQTGIQLTVKNDYGEFNPHYDGKSLWNGFLPRNKTLVRIQAGYTDGSGNQFPSDPTQGIFIMDGEISIFAKTNIARISCKSIVSPFQDVRADEIAGIGATGTASEIIARIRDHTDGSNNYLFRQFITSTAWTIQSTTINYNFATSTVLAEFSAWDFMVKLAESEGFVLYPTRTGGLVFSDRLPNTTSSQFSFYGAGFRRPNVIRINDYKEATNKLFTHIRLKYLEDDTETSFVTAGTTTTIDPDSLEWRFGRKTLEVENTFVQNQSSAEGLVRKLIGEFSNLRSEVEMDSVFHPDLDILDLVDVSYREGSLNSIQLWDRRDWAADTSTSDTAIALTWASETGSAIEFNQKRFKVLSRSTNLDNFTTRFRLREQENAII